MKNRTKFEIQYTTPFASISICLILVCTFAF